MVGHSQTHERLKCVKLIIFCRSLCTEVGPFLQAPGLQTAIPCQVSQHLHRCLSSLKQRGEPAQVCAKRRHPHAGRLCGRQRTAAWREQLPGHKQGEMTLSTLHPPLPPHHESITRDGTAQGGRYTNTEACYALLQFTGWALSPNRFAVIVC